MLDTTTVGAVAAAAEAAQVWRLWKLEGLAAERVARLRRALGERGISSFAAGPDAPDCVSSKWCVCGMQAGATELKRTGGKGVSTRGTRRAGRRN